MAFMRRGVFPEVMAVSGLVVLKPNPQRGLMGPLQVRMTWSAANVLRSASARHATLEKVWLALATPQIEAPTSCPCNRAVPTTHTNPPAAAAWL